MPNRVASVALIGSILLAGLVGCTKATIIGTGCKKDSDCNVKGQVCAPGFNAGPSICTHTCTSNTGTAGCPIGYDCYPTSTTIGSTCNKALYEVDATTGDPLLFGVDCSLGDATCTGLGSTNSAPTCRKIPDHDGNPVPNDPNAYCTGACTADTDCPLDFSCATDYDKVKKCLRRELCSACVVNDNCPSDFPVCIPTKDGTSSYCSKECTGGGECGGTQNTAFECSHTTDALKNDIRACTHRYGACVGAGNICDPCRTTADCAKSMSSCIVNSATGERFCSVSCTSDAVCTAGQGTVPSACDDTNLPSTANPEGTSLGLCNGDVKHISAGLLSCWLPE